MGCMSQCAKYFLCLFNFVFFIAGGAVLTVGIWLMADRNSFTNLISKVDQSDVWGKTDMYVIRIIACILIVAGVLTFIVSFLGYCGAMFESRCLLCVYGILILVVLILESVAIGLAFGFRGDVERITKDFFKTTIQYYASSSDKNEAVTTAWNKAMSQMHCCGVDSYEDFQNYSQLSASGKMVPDACCIRYNDGTLKDPDCPSPSSSPSSYYQQGCYNVVVELLKENAAIVIAVPVVLLFVELLVIILALYLACCYWRPQHACVDVSSRQAW